MKERLTGAIILVALIVLLVPELLKGPVRPAPRATAAAAEEPPLRSYTITLGEDAHARSAPAQPSSPEPPAPVIPAASSGAPPAAEPVTATEVPDSAAPAPAPPKSDSKHAAVPPASTASGDSGTGYMVQLGSFVNRHNAERLAQQLKSSGYPASVSQGSSGRHLYRVRVGPVHDPAAAAQLQGHLKAAGHSGSIVPK